MSEFNPLSAGSPCAGHAGSPTTEPPPPPPLPPPLVNAWPAGRLDTASPRSPSLEELASMPENWLLERPESPPYLFEPVYYFFYGTLMKPEILKGVLGVETEVALREARTCGYELANWGQYKALIDGEPGSIVTGRAYLVQSVEEEYKLAYYETSAYEAAPCNIYFIDSLGKEEGEPALGKTFRYAGDARALRQGRFDRTLWEMQMRERLPPQWREGEGRDTEQKE